MKRIQQIEQISDSLKGSVIALGNFDGFHRGHQHVVAHAGKLAKVHDSSLSVMTMEPHPRSFFAPDAPAFRITPALEKAQLLEAFGVDILVELPFNQNTAGMSAAAFIEDILVGALGVKGVVVGYDYHFGKGRSGNVDTLRDYGQRLGFDVVVVDPVSVGVEGSAGEIYSSTLVREALHKGEARRAAALLGHWWTHSGEVIKGDQRGRTIQFPTANVEFGQSIIPRLGVYAVRAMLNDQPGEIIHGVANIGKRPTFDKKDILLEVHLFDFDQEIYGQQLDVEFVSFIRAERKFDGLQSLKDQIALDCEVAKTVLADPQNKRDDLRVPHVADLMRLLPA